VTSLDITADTSPVLTVSDTAALLGLDTRTVRRACERGELPAVKVGRRTLVVRAKLAAMLSAREAS
jgi:excisionase family DNA binding protein